MQNKKLWIVVGVVVIIGLFFLSSYNRLVTANETIDGQWAQVEAQYQRRFDLIPNVVASVDKIMAQEQKVFGDLAAARAQYSGARTVDEKVAAASQVETSFGRLLAVMENYPQLRSVETVNAQIAEIAGTENRISVERMRFNEAVRLYNTSIKRFPTMIIANLFGFDARAYFEAAAGAEVAPVVK